MMKRFYRIAGLDFTVSAPRELMPAGEGRLEAFRGEEAPEPLVFTFEKREKLSCPEGECIAQLPHLRVYAAQDQTVRYMGAVGTTWEDAHMRVRQQGKRYEVQLSREHYPAAMGNKTILEAMCLEHLIAENQGYILHCSCIGADGKAILFTAPSGTGKSTQAELWKELRGAQIINGDRIAVCLRNGILTAEGIPVSGSSEYCMNRSLPIRGIVYLGQAPQTSIRALNGYAAFARIWEGISLHNWDKHDAECISALVQETVRRIPIWYMSCTPDESAVIALEKELRKEAR